MRAGDNARLSELVGRTFRWRMSGHRVVIEGGIVYAFDGREGIPSPWPDDPGKTYIWTPEGSALGIDAQSVFTGITLVTTITLTGGQFRMRQGRSKRTVTLSLLSEGALTWVTTERPHAKPQQLTPGHGTVTFPGDDVILDVEPGTRIIVVECPIEVLQGHRLGARSTPIAVQRDGTLAEPIRDFADAILRRGGVGQLNTYLTDQLLGEMLVGVVLSIAAIGHLEQSSRADLYAAALALISARFIDPQFSLQPLADLVKTSPRTLQAAFTAKGQNVTRAIRDRRIEEARRLLTTPGFAMLTIEQIAEASGFGTSRRLRRAFEAAHLSSPSRHR